MKHYTRDFTPNTSSRGLRPWVLLAGALLLTSAFVACSPVAQVEAPQATSQLISPSDYMEQFGENQAHSLIDVRTPGEFATGHIPGALNIAVEELPSRLAEIHADQPTIVYCQSGNRSAAAARILIEAGFTPVYDLGGIQDWISQGFPIER